MEIDIAIVIQFEDIQPCCIFAGSLLIHRRKYNGLDKKNYKKYYQLHKKTKEKENIFALCIIICFVLQYYLELNYCEPVTLLHYTKILESVFCLCYSTDACLYFRLVWKTVETVLCLAGVFNPDLQETPFIYILLTYHY